MTGFFHYRNRITPWRDQMSGGHLVEIPACGRLENILRAYD
jgi:hypothetical protein